MISVTLFNYKHNLQATQAYTYSTLEKVLKFGLIVTSGLQSTSHSQGLMLPHPKGVCTDRQVHILYVITLIKKWVMTAWFQHSHFKIQAGLYMIGFLTKHPLKRICVPVWNRAFPKVNLSSPVLLALFPRVDFLLTPPGGKEVHTPRFTARFLFS